MAMIPVEIISRPHCERDSRMQEKGSGPFRSVRMPGSATLARDQGNQHCEVTVRGRSADPGTTTSQPQWGVWRSFTAHTRLLWNLSAQVPCGTDNTLMNYTDLAQSRLRYVTQNSGTMNPAVGLQNSRKSAWASFNRIPSTSDRSLESVANGSMAAASQEVMYV